MAFSLVSQPQEGLMTTNPAVQQPGLATPVTGTLPPPPTGFSVTPPDVISAPLFDSQLTTEDVVNRRNTLQYQTESKAMNQNTLQGLYQQLMSGNMSGLIQRPQTDAATMRQQLLDSISGQTKAFADNYGNNIQDAYSRSGVNEANNALSDIQEQIGDRQVRQRQDLRNLETSPNRATARTFFQDRKNEINRAANEELADLAIQELAASGRYDRALEIANADIDEQAAAFQQSIDAFQAQLDAIQPTLDQEDQLFANTLRFQLGQVEAQAQQERDNQKTVVETAMEAAAQGAPQDLVRQIANANSPEEAAALAAPYIGLQERLSAQASRANIWSQINARKTEGSTDVKAKAKLEQGLNRADTVLRNTFEAISKVSGFGFDGILKTPKLGTAGVGSALKYLPGTEQRALASTIDTIKANLGFAELQAMRDASPTGGALGQVAIQELVYLQAALANLDQGLPPDELKSNLNEVIGHFENWVQAVGASEGRHFEIAQGIEGVPDGTIIEITQ